MTVCSKDRISIPFFILFLGLVLLVSCRKNEDTVGSDFIGARVGFNVQSWDTATVIAYTSKSDSVPTNRVPYLMLGNMNDPEIGTTQAAIVTQVDLPYPAFPTFALNKSTIDSVVLQLPYAGTVYGNAATTQVIRVYELTQNLPDSSIYSDKRYTTNPIALGSWTNNYTRLSDSVSITLNGASVKLAPQIRIKLDDISFVSKLKNASSSDFGTTDNFKLFLKGFHIVPELGPLSPAQGGLAYMNLGAPSAAMVVYYTDSLGAQMKAEFPISGSSTAKGNLFSHTTLPSVMVQPAMGGTPQNTCYVQPAAGLKTRILFPYLFDFAKDKNIAITGAEVIVSTDQTRDTSVYKLPVWMVLNSSDSLGVAQLSFDLATSDGLYYYNGYYDGSQYHFNIQREIQYWFNQYKNHGRNINYGLNLIVPIANPVAANRAILDTRPGKIKLKLSYTVIN